MADHQSSYASSRSPTRGQSASDRLARARSRHQQQMLQFKRLLEAAPPSPSFLQLPSSSASQALQSLAGSPGLYVQSPPPPPPPPPPASFVPPPPGSVQQLPVEQQTTFGHQQVVSPLSTAATFANNSPVAASSFAGTGGPRPITTYSTVMPPAFAAAQTLDLRVTSPEATHEDFTPEMLATLNSSVKDHVILRQQEKIHELILQKRDALASVDSMISEFTSMQSADKQTIVDREQSMLHQLKVLQGELDFVRGNTGELEQLREQLAKEREHLRFAVGKLGRFEEREKALYGQLQQVTQSAAENRRSHKPGSIKSSDGYGRAAPMTTSAAAAATAAVAAKKLTKTSTAAAAAAAAPEAVPRVVASAAFSAASKQATVPLPSASERLSAAAETVQRHRGAAEVQPPSEASKIPAGVQNRTPVAAPKLKHRALTDLMGTEKSGRETPTELVSSPGGTFPTWNI